LTCALVIGGSSSASAAGDPLRVRVCGNIIGFCAPIADVSVQQLIGPGAGELVCQGQTGNRFSIGTVPGGPWTEVYFCEEF
jgi:hypothetical protein